MATDMRSKQYPALPAASERPLRIVLPRSGDLRYRSALPRAFLERLFVHADERQRLLYARFSLVRKFIVMSAEGDLYTKTAVSALTLADVKLLALPMVAPGDLLKVLDLVECHWPPQTPVRWELALVRWRTGMETWLPVEAVGNAHAHLLQAFYVNSVNSWALRARILPATLAAHQTEVELWLYHKEFQRFYQALRRQRTPGQPQVQQQQQTSPTAAGPDVKPSMESLDQPAAQQPASTAYRIPTRTATPVTTQSATPAARTAPAQPTPTSAGHRPPATQHQLPLPLPLPSLLPPRPCQEQPRAGGHGQPNHRLQQLHQQALQQQHQQQQRFQQQQQVQPSLTPLRHLTTQQTLQTPPPFPQQSRSIAPTPHRPMEQGRRLNDTPSEPPTMRLELNDRANQQPSTQGRQFERPPANLSARPGSASSVRSSSSTSAESHGRVRQREDRPSGSNQESNRSRSSRESSQLSPERNRQRKRLVHSHVDDDDDDDDFPVLSRPPTIQKPKDLSKDSASSKEGGPSQERHKTRKRLRQSHSKETNGTDDVDATILEIDTEGNASDNPNDTDKHKHKHKQPHSESGGGSSHSPRRKSKHPPSPRPVDDDKDDEPGGVLSFLIGREPRDCDLRKNPAPAEKPGKVDCDCGATSVGDYIGRWLKCVKCDLWEHADCVGALVTDDGEFVDDMDEYKCSSCDSQAFGARRSRAYRRLIEWMFQCCESHNTIQLQILLVEAAKRKKRGDEWLHAKKNRVTLPMKIARHGLKEGLTHILSRPGSGLMGSILATDTMNQNVLHHAALGGSAECCRLLFEHEPKLLDQINLNGVTPLHLMLQSTKLGALCVRILQGNRELAGRCDHKSNFPIHYACQATNKWTAEIVSLCLGFNSATLHQKSGEGLLPLMLLSRATGISSDEECTPNEVAVNFKKTLDVILGFDVFGLCLNKKSARGWTAAHFLAAVGNHEGIVHLGNTGLVDLNAVAMEGLTPLHIAAMVENLQCIQRLLEFGVDIMAKDTAGRIALLHASEPACIREFMHHKLTKQISRLHRMLPRHHHQGLVRQWQRRAVLDPTTFNMLNDWCSADPSRIERMDGIFLTNRFMLRLDNKLDLIYNQIIPSLRPAESTDIPVKKMQFVITSALETSFWRQFVKIASTLESSDFRLPFVFAMTSSKGRTITYDASNVKLVLIRLAADILREEQGVLIRGNQDDADIAAIATSKKSLFSDMTKDAIQSLLNDFLVLGELMAHFVLHTIPTSSVFNFSPWFLEGVFSEEANPAPFLLNCPIDDDSPSKSYWSAVGQSFKLGFDSVMPLTLSLLHADEFRILQNASSEITLNACAIDWSNSVEWVADNNGTDASDESDASDGANPTPSWFARLSTELVNEEQQLLLLFMTQTLTSANLLFFPAAGEDWSVTPESNVTRKRIRIVVGDGGDPQENFDAAEQVGTLPRMCHDTKTLYLPQYADYESYRRGILCCIRRLRCAFMPLYD